MNDIHVEYSWYFAKYIFICTCIRREFFSKLKIHVLLLSILLVFDWQKNTGRLTKNAKLNKQNNTLPNKTA